MGWKFVSSQKLRIAQFTHYTVLVAADTYKQQCLYLLSSTQFYAILDLACILQSCNMLLC